MASDLRSYARPAFREVETTLRESRKRLERAQPTAALWWIFRAFEELDDATKIVQAIERDEGDAEND